MNSKTEPTGVLVMAYGTPASYEDVEVFYTDVRRGRPPTAEQVADLRRRYAAVGGTSQLAERTADQVAGIQAALEARAPGRFICRYGSKHSAPKIERAVDELAALGAGGVVGIVLAPHYSAGSIGEYLARARKQAADRELPAAFIEDWHDNAVLVELLAERVRAAYARVAALPGEHGTELLVTAHSLPQRIIDTGDGYDVRLAETAQLVAEAAGVSKWRVCWQSAGRTPEPWIGPDLVEVIGSLAGQDVRNVVVCPAGFTSDHLEVNYDIDIEARRVAEAAGMGFARTASLNAEPSLCEALAELISDTAKKLHA
ncbi:MAG: ferrochelatase [Acidimicrobiales bacterium]